MALIKNYYFAKFLLYTLTSNLAFQQTLISFYKRFILQKHVHA